MSSAAPSEREQFEKAAEEIAITFCEGVTDKNLGSYVKQIADIIMRQARAAAPQNDTPPTPDPPCWHKEINEEGICKACGTKAAIRLPFSVEEFNHMLRVPNPVAKAEDAFDSQEFYELMQAYRHTPLERQSDVISAFEAVKSFVRGAAAPPALGREQKSLWGWPLEEIKSALRQWQSRHPMKSPLEVERDSGASAEESK